MQLLAGSHIIYVDQSLKEDRLLLLAGLLGTVTIVLSFSCISRQKNSLQTNPFVNLYFIVCVYGLFLHFAVCHAAGHLPPHVLEFHELAIARTF